MKLEKKKKKISTFFGFFWDEIENEDFECFNLFSKYMIKKQVSKKFLQNFA